MFPADDGGIALKLVLALVDDLAARDPDLPNRVESLLRSSAKNASDADEADLSAAAQLLSER